MKSLDCSCTVLIMAFEIQQSSVAPSYVGRPAPLCLAIAKILGAYLKIRLGLQPIRVSYPFLISLSAAQSPGSERLIQLKTAV